MPDRPCIKVPVTSRKLAEDLAVYTGKPNNGVRVEGLGLCDRHARTDLERLAAGVTRVRLVQRVIDDCRASVDHDHSGRVVPFRQGSKRPWHCNADHLRQKGASYLFEFTWKKPYSDRGVRPLLERDAAASGLAHPVSP